MKKKKNKKLRFGGLLVIILAIYLIISAGIYIYKMPIKKVVVNGNTYLKDNYIINALDISNKSIFSIKKSEIKKKLLNISLISKVEVKKNYLGTLIINITEDKALFYNRNTNKVVLSSGKEVDYSSDFVGIPTLINYVKDDAYEELVDKLDRVTKDTLGLVSEIEYSPSEINKRIVDDKRFLFRMNDGNIVYINTLNIEKINSYLEIYEAVMSQNGEVKGCLYLDSNSKNKHFGSCEEKKIVTEGEDGEN